MNLKTKKHEYKFVSTHHNPKLDIQESDKQKPQTTIEKKLEENLVLPNDQKASAHAFKILKQKVSGILGNEDTIEYTIKN